jgi:hypothetical protein
MMVERGKKIMHRSMLFGDDLETLVGEGTKSELKLQPIRTENQHKKLI